jgi:hypothetical protein
MQTNQKFMPSLPPLSLPTTTMAINYQEISPVMTGKLLQVADWMESRTVVQQSENTAHRNDKKTRGERKQNQTSKPFWEDSFHKLV